MRGFWRGFFIDRIVASVFRSLLEGKSGLGAQSLFVDWGGCRGQGVLVEPSRQVSMFGQMPRGSFGRERIGERAPFHGVEWLRRSKKIEAAIARIASDNAGSAAAHLDDIGVCHGSRFQAAAHFAR